MPGYVWNGSSWVTMGSAWTWDGSAWNQIESGWAWNGSGWSNIFSSGTFSPTLRNPTGGALFSNRSVGLAIQLYRGSDALGSYAYKFQYSYTQQDDWVNEDTPALNNSGTLTGTTTTTSFSTDISYLSALENAAYSGDVGGEISDVDTYRRQDGKFIFLRARVIKSGETQFTNIVRIQKRRPVDTGTYLQLTRAGGGVFNLSTTNRSPRPGDTLRWITSFTNTTTFTNDTRPDYYWISFDGGVGTLERNSVITDVANPRNPINTGSYTVQAGDVGAQIVTNLRAINSNTDTTDLSFATLEVSDGALQAPQNLNLSLLGGNLQGSWDASLGGNDNAITYVYSLEKDGVVIFTSTSQSATIFSRAASGNGNYRFRVTASQTGSVSVISDYSNTYILIPPLAFNVTVQNVTNAVQYLPSAFTINAPVLSSTVLSRYDYTWTTSTITGPAYAKTGSFNVTSVNLWDSILTDPFGVESTLPDITSPTDYWIIEDNGNHTQTVVAKNNRKNFVRVSWTKPAGTSAVSYRVTINAYSAATNGSLDWSRTINVEDINFVDIEHNYSANGAYSNGQTVLVTSVTAYDGSGQTGTSRAGTLPQFNQFGADGTTSWSGCNVISSASTARTDNLLVEVPSVGQLTTTGIFEPGETLSLVQGGGTWSPSYTNWTKTSYNWLKSRTIQPATAGTSSTQVIANNSTAVGSEFFCEVVMNYKGTIRTVYSSVANIVPGPPSYSLTDLLNQTFRISGVISNGGTSFYGTYTGVSSGTIPETIVSGGTYTSPTVNVGSISTEVFSRRYVTQVYPNTVNNIQINGTRSTVNTVTIATPPQSTGSRRYLATAPSVGAGSTLHISTNGYFGNTAMPANNYLNSTLPTPGAFLNIAAQDLVMVSCFTKVDSGGTWIRYRGYRYNTPGGPFLEYQAYLTFAGEAYVLFIENGLTDYRTNLAYFISGTQQSTWSGNSSQDNTNFTINQGTSGWISRAVTTGSNDDGVVSFTVTAPARQHQASAVTRTAGGFTFNITNVADSTFESAATYTVTINRPSPAAASINTSTGLVTVTGLTASQFADVTVSKARFGFDSPTNVVVQGQALAGAAPVQTVAPTISASGTADGSGTVRRAQVGATVSGSAGTYNNQASITSGLLTILSNAYTGADSNWTSSGVFANSVSIANSAASSSANMYRWRDRVVGTDGSTVDFYTPVIYRAVYAPPPGGLSTPQQTSIGISYTGGSGPQRYYRYQNGSELNFLTDGGAGPFFTNFTGLTPDTPYTIQLFGGNNEGYLSVTAIGGATRTAAASSQLATPTGVTASTTFTDRIRITWNAVANASTYGVWYRGGAPVLDSAPDFPTTSSLFLDDTGVASGGQRQYDVQAYPAAGSTSFTKSNWGGPSNLGLRAVAPPPTAPEITSGPSISWASGNNFTLSASASNATNLEFFVEFANNNGGPALRNQTFFFGASSGGGTTGAQANSWARTRVRANNTTTGLSSAFTAFSGWA